MSHLRACSGCSRHVRVAEVRCPFCDATLDSVAAPMPPALRLGRAALLAFGAAATTASLAAAACSTGTVPAPLSDASADADADAPRDTGLPDTSNIAMPYGAPPADGLCEWV